MITDPLFYRLFETSPETFFLLLGMSPDAAREMAARYQFQAVEFKETSHRTDGVFLPAEPGLPVYFVEVQFYSLASVFAGLAVIVGLQTLPVFFAWMKCRNCPAHHSVCRFCT